MNAKNKLEDLDIYEVSLVGSPANKRRYLLVKSEEGGDEMSDEANVAAVADIEKAELTEEQANAIKGAVNILGKYADKLSAKLKAAIATLEESVAKAMGGKKEEEDEEEEDKGKGKGKYGYLKPKGEVQKAIAEVEQSFRERIEKAEANAKALSERLEAKELEEISKSSGVEIDWLKTLKRHLPEAEFQKAVSREETHQRQLKEAGLFKEIGSSATGEQPPGEKLLALVKGHVEKGGDQQKAWDIVVKEHPELYREYVKERNSVKSKGD